MIDGDFNVDTATGIFVGDDLEIKSMGGTLDTATIHGNFHGDGASGMTGIYTDNAAEPRSHWGNSRASSCGFPC